jgi:hypothetical protein
MIEPSEYKYFVNLSMSNIMDIYIPTVLIHNGTLQKGALHKVSSLTVRYTMVHYKMVR